MQLEKGFKSGQNFHELSQSDIRNIAIFVVGTCDATIDATKERSSIRSETRNSIELLQSDILTCPTRMIRGLSRRVAPNWERAYHWQGNATEHREENDVESTHVSVKV